MLASLTNFRRMVAIRRALIWLTLIGAAVAMFVTRSPILLLIAVPAVLLFYTDVCPNCGQVLFLARPRRFIDWLNPLYVPTKCDRCGHDLS